MNNKGCEHPLTGVCALLNLVGSFIYLKNWDNSGPSENLLPRSTAIIYKRAIDDTRRNDALPIVAYDVGDLSISRFMRTIGSEQLGGEGSVSGKVDTTVTFTVSSPNYALTSSLAYAIGTFCFALSDTDAVSELAMDGVTISSVTKNQADFYESTVSINCAANVISWKFNDLEDKLREIQLSYTVD